MTAAMTSSERAELSKVVRLRAKVAKDEIGQREARLVADFEAKLAAKYDAQDEAWAELTKEAERHIAAVDAEIAKRCRDLGVPDAFRPSIAVSWYGRGANAQKERRAELRQVARTEIEARGKKAKVEIDRHAVDLLTQLAAGALGTDDAKQFLASMPKLEALMPPLELDEVGAKTPLKLVGAA